MTLYAGRPLRADTRPPPVRLQELAGPRGQAVGCDYVKEGHRVVLACTAASCQQPAAFVAVEVHLCHLDLNAPMTVPANGTASSAETWQNDDSCS